MVRNDRNLIGRCSSWYIRIVEFQLSSVREVPRARQGTR